MWRGLTSIGLVLWGATWALAGGPHGGAPTQQLVRIDSSGTLQVYYQVQKCIPETQTRTVAEKVPVTETYNVEVDGKTVPKQRTVYKEVHKQVAVTVMKTVCEAKVRQASLDKLKAFETDGKAIPVKKLKERLTEDTLVVVSPNDKMIPDFYAGLFKPGTIILTFEPEPIAMPMPPAGVVPAPAAPGRVKPDEAKLDAPAIRFVSQAKEKEEDGDEKSVQVRVPDSAPAPNFPHSPAPLFVFASREGADDYRFRQQTEFSYEATGYKVKRQGTGKQMVPVKMMQTSRHNEITKISGKDLQFFGGDGAALAVDRIKERLGRETTVLYSGNGEPIDSFWLQNLKPTTLVIAGPQLPGGCGGPMGYGGYGGYGMPVPIQAPAPAPTPPATEKAPPPPAD